MKKILPLLFFIVICGFAKAQNYQPQGQGSHPNIEALKVAFISKDLNLTPEEAQSFWPVYNQYSKEVHVVMKNNSNVLDRDEKILEIRKRYNEQFIKIIGSERTNRLFSAEGRFHQLLLRAMRRQQNGPSR